MKSNLFTRILFFIICSGLLYSCSPGLNKTFRKDKIFQHGFSGLALYDPAAGKMLYQHNADKYFTPASNTKLFTFYAGLKFLEDSIAGFHYTTSQDSLIFSGTGDPSFLNPAFKNSKLPNFFKDANKELYYVKANWQEAAFGAGWAWDDYNYAFAAEKSAFPIFGNLVSFNHSNASLNVLPIYFKDSVSIIAENGAFQRIQNKNRFEIPDNTESYFRRIPFRTSEELSVKLLSDSLKKSIEIIDDPTYLSRLNKSYFTIAADSLYKQMLQESDNFIAEQILLMISQKISDTLKTSIAIDAMQKKYLKDLPDEFIWKDGSGLSRYNLATPRSMIKILDKILKEKPGAELFPLFPAAGKSGTLKNMFQDKNIRLFAKSGSLSNNYSLSGYLFTKSGKLLIFSFMNSNYTVASKDLKNEMEAILLKIRKHY